MKKTPPDYNFGKRQSRRRAFRAASVYLAIALVAGAIVLPRLPDFLNIVFQNFWVHEEADFARALDNRRNFVVLRVESVRDTGYSYGKRWDRGEVHPFGFVEINGIYLDVINSVSTVQYYVLKFNGKYLLAGMPEDSVVSQKVC